MNNKIENIKNIVPADYLKGVFTGFYDMSEPPKPIHCGDTIRYEYMVGFTRTKIKGQEKETKLRCFPFAESENTFHETMMKYQVRQDCAGFWLDIPYGINWAWFKDTLKYFIVAKHSDKIK